MPSHKLPSDLDFIRYVDITAKKWPMISQKFLDVLRDNAPNRAIISNINQTTFDIERLKRDLDSLVFQKENNQRIKYEEFKIHFILLRNNRLLGIIKNAKFLKDGTYFNLYVTEDYIEEKKAVIRIESINEEKGIAQIEIIVIKDCVDYWAAIAKDCSENGHYILGEHRLEIIVQDEFKKLNIDDLKKFRQILDKCW